MQKIQILRGTPGPTFKLTSADTARQLSLANIYKKSLIVNGDMEVDDNWASYGTPAANTQSSAQALTGSNSRLFTPNAANEGIQSDDFTVPINSRTRYPFSVFPDDGTVVSVIVLAGDGVTVAAAQTFTGLTENAWNDLFIDVDDKVGGESAAFIIHSGAQTSGDFYIDNVFGSRLDGGRQISARKATGARITIETNDIRWANGGTTPTFAAGTGVGHLEADPTEIFLDNFDAIKNFKYISNVSSTAGILQCTVEF